MPYPPYIIWHERTGLRHSVIDSCQRNVAKTHQYTHTHTHFTYRRESNVFSQTVSHAFFPNDVCKCTSGKNLLCINTSALEALILDFVVHIYCEPQGHEKVI